MANWRMMTQPARHPTVYADVVGGVEVYDAVLNHGVRAPAELAAHLRARGKPED